MFIRIVKMSFHQENISKFLENFDLMKEKIRNSARKSLSRIISGQKQSLYFFHIQFLGNRTRFGKL
jgi:hypothetical protein